MKKGRRAENMSKGIGAATASQPAHGQWVHGLRHHQLSSGNAQQQSAWMMQRPMKSRARERLWDGIGRAWIGF